MTSYTYRIIAYYQVEMWKIIIQNAPPISKREMTVFISYMY
jgi:hypothetical protein